MTSIDAATLVRLRNEAGIPTVHVSHDDGEMRQAEIQSRDVQPRLRRRLRRRRGVAGNAFVHPTVD
jgi:hypothetical protein